MSADMMRQVVSIGWVLASDVRDPQLLSAYEAARHRLQAMLADQFPQFEWQIHFWERRTFPPRGALPPLDLLEIGVQEKLYHGWDYAIVLVPNDLHPRHRPFVIGVPSSALEVAVLSTARLGDSSLLAERIVGLALHLLGHIWGLDHGDGPMRPPEDPLAIVPAPFTNEQWAAILNRLKETADTRLEEERVRWGRLAFYWRTLRANPTSLLADILGYAPWRFPFRMGRLTAAAAVSTVFLVLTAEAWEVGVNLSLWVESIATFGAILIAALFIFLGQNVSDVARETGWREQIVRTQFVLFTILLIGMLFLWAVLFLLMWGILLLLPRDVISGWASRPLDWLLLMRYAAFMATLGVLAGALGGNLEEEDELKAELYYDEET
ncbi:MAG: hypothetical protein D6802_10150 [Ardenticatenia bacterium]|nr:MAG: hypothetical protein D6802_10150 [Ardenticatenia bacterium]